MYGNRQRGSCSPTHSRQPALINYISLWADSSPTRAPDLTPQTRMKAPRGFGETSHTHTHMCLGPALPLPRLCRRQKDPDQYNHKALGMKSMQLNRRVSPGVITLFIP